jgi:N-acetylglucosaminyl-diphospho-decaprenol L-rhamnosyltransferase
MSSIGVVIVTWNSGATIDRCLESCAGLSVTVVDNASSDDTVERVRRHADVYLIVNSENLGFAAAANQGIARTPDDTVLLLNPDVELLNSVEPLAEACCVSDVVIAAGRLVDSKGATQTGFTVRRLPTPLTLAFEAIGLNRLVPSNRVNRRYRCLDLNPVAPADVEQPAGALLLFRRELWREIGGFDEQFSPLWFEDVDFCKRALQRGRIRYVPSVAARHQGGASIASLDWASREVYWYDSLLRYASKHFTPGKFRGVCAAVVLASAIRSLIGLFQRRTLKVITVYARIAGHSVQCLMQGRMGSVARVEGVSGTGLGGVRIESGKLPDTPRRVVPRVSGEKGSRVRTITSSTK